MVKLSPFAIVIRLVAFLMLGMGARELSAATFVKADVTTLLGPSFFIDDPVIGGTTDVVVHQPGSGTYVRSFSGLLAANQGSTTLTITGLGFASNSSTTNNDAMTITYLGADGAAGQSGGHLDGQFHDAGPKPRLPHRCRRSAQVSRPRQRQRRLAHLRAANAQHHVGKARVAHRVLHRGLGQYRQLDRGGQLQLARRVHVARGVPAMVAALLALPVQRRGGDESLGDHRPALQCLQGRWHHAHRLWRTLLCLGWRRHRARGQGLLHSQQSRAEAPAKRRQLHRPQRALDPRWHERHAMGAATHRHHGLVLHHVTARWTTAELQWQRFELRRRAHHRHRGAVDARRGAVRLVLHRKPRRLRQHEASARSHRQLQHGQQHQHRRQREVALRRALRARGDRSSRRAHRPRGHHGPHSGHAQLDRQPQQRCLLLQSLSQHLTERSFQRSSPAIFTANSFTNTALQNGTAYYYTVTATDLTGYESVQSTSSVATPVIATLPLPSSFTATATGNSYTISWPSTHLGWILESQSNGLVSINWIPVPDTSTTTSYQVPAPSGSPPIFFRLRRP